MGGSLLEALELAPGQTLLLGDAAFTVAKVITAELDRAAASWALRRA